MLDKVKLALRINHSRLDTDIEETIATARAEMIRAGVSPTVALSECEVVEMAIKTYCRYIYQDEKLFESWQYQVDNLRKSVIL